MVIRLHQHIMTGTQAEYFHFSFCAMGAETVAQAEKVHIPEIWDFELVQQLDKTLNCLLGKGMSLQPLDRDV